MVPQNASKSDIPIQACIRSLVNETFINVLFLRGEGVSRCGVGGGWAWYT